MTEKDIRSLIAQSVTYSRIFDSNYSFLFVGGNVETNLRKILLVVVVLCMEGISFGMVPFGQEFDVVPMEDVVSFDVVLSDMEGVVSFKAKNVKLLEHSCFKGESLLFQNEFFSSNYLWLPTYQKKTIGTILGRDQLGIAQYRAAVLDYHKYYRKECSDILEKAKKFVDNTKHIDDESASDEEKASDRKNFERYKNIKVMQCENMKMAYNIKDYPLVLYMNERYF